MRGWMPLQRKTARRSASSYALSAYTARVSLLSRALIWVLSWGAPDVTLTARTSALP
jgi:hypothetical protein